WNQFMGVSRPFGANKGATQTPVPAVGGGSATVCDLIPSIVRQLKCAAASERRRGVSGLGRLPPPCGVCPLRAVPLGEWERYGAEKRQSETHTRSYGDVGSNPLPSSGEATKPLVAARDES